MSIEIIIVLSTSLLAVYLFATEKLSVDLIALIVMVILLLTGIITPSEGLAGFSNTATVTVAAMFVLSASLQKVGVVVKAASLVTKLFKNNFWTGLLITMIVVGFISSFVNNTPVVAIFIPILLNVAKENNISVSKLLMPISFSSMFGGVCTLIGTSTNILVSSIAADHGLTPFSMFEFTPMGLLFFVVGTIYLFIVGIRLIPDRRSTLDSASTFKVNDYVTEIVLEPEAKSVGKPLSESPLVKELDIDVLEVIRNKQSLKLPPSKTILQAGDILRVRCDINEIQKIKDRLGVELIADYKWRSSNSEDEETTIVEAIIAPNSDLIGKTLKSSEFRNRFQATALALRHRGKLIQDRFADIPLSAGDALLIEVKTDNLNRLSQNYNFVLVTHVPMPKYRKRKILTAVPIIISVILFAALGIAPIVVTAVAGSVLLVLTRCITITEAYQSIDWKVIFLLGGILPLGIAMEKTGAAQLLSDFLIKTLGDFGPVALVAVFYLITTLLTETMSNNATVVLLAPIAITAAASMNIDPRPLLMAVTFAGSASFMTPVGYQTNTMIFGIGQYKFKDFLIVGTPLNILFLILAAIFIPYFFPF